MQIRCEGSIAIVTIDNPPVNALSQTVRQSLIDAVDALEADASVHAVVLCCAGRTFIAGADVMEFDRPPEEPHLPDVVARIEAAAKPWVAAIHGTALGGGLEIAIGCRWRIALRDAKLGLPEVTLGVIPGAGGTVRLPRLVSVEAAIDLVTSGKPIDAARALSLGLIDRLAETDLLDSAIAFARESLREPPSLMTRERSIASSPHDFWASAAATVRKSARGEDAPLRALACVRNATEASFDAAMAFERETFLALRRAPQSAALRSVFFAERTAKRPPEIAGVKPRPIRSAAVVGGGTMGAGIAAALRDAGLPVILVEREPAALDRGLANVRAIFDGWVKRGRMAHDIASDRMSGMIGTVDYAMLADTDLVIEAVFEDLAVKREVFAKLGEACRADAILATNTSYLDPRAIAEDLPDPERFLGLHFFSPAHVMRLLEIVPTPTTAPEVVATGFDLARILKKVPVGAGICDGFIGNRILKTMRAQAERLLLAGSTPSDVDAAMRSFGFAMGPFEAQDLGGLDIAAFQRKAARERGEEPFAPVADRLCEHGRLGQKSRHGWYDYTEGERAPRPSPVVATHIAEAAAEAQIVKRSLTLAELSECLVLSIVNEGAKILEERIALRPSDIDLVEIHGYGFPRWSGGPMHWAKAQGLPDVVRRLEMLARASLAPPPCAFLRSAAASGHFEVRPTLR
jgi:3-hydroxyacyl-CoA dehydrogenase